MWIVCYLPSEELWLTETSSQLGFLSIQLNYFQTTLVLLQSIQLMPLARLLITLLLISTLFFLSNTATSSPFISPNPIYSDAGTFVFDTSPYYNNLTTIFNPQTLTITFTRTHISTNYSFGYSIKHLTYSINSNQVNYSLILTTKTATSASVDFYTNNANKISNLAVSYIIIEPLFAVSGFYTTWIYPNRNFWNGQNTQLSVTGGPFTSTNQTIWTVLIGVDVVLNANNEIDLYAMAWLTSTTNIVFQISTISPTTFFIHSAIIQVFIFDSALLLANPRTARFTFGERDKDTGLSYSNSAMQSYNTIYGFRTYHTVNENFLNFQWTLSSGALSVTTTNTFLWVAFDYLILEFITCAASEPYLMLSNSTCYDVCPIRYYDDQYKQLQACPYDCYNCYSNGNCSVCSSSIDFRVMNNATGRCVALDGYYDNNVSSQALPCNSSACKTCLTLTYCLSCNIKFYLSPSNACLSCIANCDNCTTATDCQQCIAFYTFQNGSCVPDCSNITNCTSCSVTTGVVCNSCVNGYNVTSNTCAELCGNGVRTQGEECDDGNVNNLDGCSSACMIQANYYCVDTGTVNASLSSCTQCNINCTNCTSTACTLCQTNFTLANGTCTQTTANATNATAANATAGNATANATNATSGNATTNATSATNCGNGVLDAGQQCDDANTNSNDGCSNQCQVQTYFTCSATPSVCNLQQFSPSLASITKNPSANEISVSFMLQPSTLSAYQTLNWSNIVSQKSNLSITMTSASFDPNTGQLSISYNYTQNLNDKSLVLAYNLPLTSPFSLLSNITTTTTLTQESSNLSLQYYDDSTYQTANLIRFIAMILSGLALLIFLVGFFKGKIIALELIAVFQLSYLSLLSLNRLSPVFYSLIGLSLSCGYTINIFSSKTVNNHHNMLGLRMQFFDNYNTSIVFVLLPLLVSLVLSLVAKAKKLGDKQSLSVLACKLRMEWVFYGLMFSLYIFFICFGLAVFELQKMSMMEMIGLGTDGLLILALIWLGVKLVNKQEHMGEFFQSFNRQKWLSSNYYVLLILQRLMTSVALLMVALSMQAIIIIAILIIQIIMIVVLQPYLIKGRRRRPILNLSISLLIQLVYYFIPHISMPIYKQYAPFAILFLLALCLCYNIYYLIKQIRNPNATQPTDLNDNPNEEFKLLNSERMKLQLNATFLHDNQSILNPNPKDTTNPHHLSAIKEQLIKMKEPIQDSILQLPADTINISTLDDFSAI